jgi:hypothetical protein
MEELLAFIGGIEDRRQEWKVEHKLKDIVVIVLFATLANAEDFVEIGLFAQANEEVLKRYIGLEKGIPSHDTIQRVMSSIKPEEMKGLFEVWRKMCQEGEGERIKRILNIDGKTIRANGNKNQEALHIVSAWSKEGGICFGQKEVEGQGNEIRAIKRIIESGESERTNSYDRCDRDAKGNSREDKKRRRRICISSKEQSKEII